MQYPGRGLRFVSMPALVFGAAGFGLEGISIAINHDFARSMVSHVWAAHLYGAAFVAVDVIKVALFSELAIVAEQRRYVRLLGYFVFWLMTCAISVYAAAGFASKNFGDTVAERGAAKTKSTGVNQDLDQARADLAAMERTRPSATITQEKNDAAGRVTKAMWETTNECKDTQAKGATAACEKHGRLASEEAAALAREATQRRVDELAAKQHQAPVVGSADPSAEGIARHSGNAIPPALTAALQFWLIITVIPFGGSICVGIAREKVRHTSTATRVTAGTDTPAQVAPTRDDAAPTRDAGPPRDVTPPKKPRTEHVDPTPTPAAPPQPAPKTNAQRSREWRARKKENAAVRVAAEEAGKVVPLPSRDVSESPSDVSESPADAPATKS